MQTVLKFFIAPVFIIGWVWEFIMLSFQGGQETCQSYMYETFIEGYEDE